jgi:hypothetical protein
MHASAQKIDTAITHNKRLNNIFAFALRSISRHRGDTAVIKGKGQTPFLPYQGKIIRHITFKEFGFEQPFSDTSKRINYFGTKLLNKLHTKTKEWVVRDNLFLQENTALDAYKAADNETYYRSLEFIQDARILVTPIPGNPDSVDLVVITKDLFSLTGSVSSFTPGNYQVSIGDANLGGMGQKFIVSTALQNNRSPGLGYSFLYTKTSIRHSFINFVAGYSTISPDLYNGMTDEHDLLLSLQMPLVSPYAHCAGALTIGRNQTFNSYMEAPISFYNYGYNIQDAWLGYNLDVGKYRLNKSFKDKHFVALRYFKNSFFETPEQTQGTYNFRYDDKQAVLGQVTFFRQEFYKTNYIYGFGTTEDVPIGYNVAVTTGWYRQLNLNRSYAGINANRYFVTKGGSFTQYFLRMGGFLNAGQLQDATLLAGAGFFSRLFEYHNFKLREYINFSYTGLYNRVGLDPLYINNNYGLRNFSSDSVMGNNRISLYAETFSFLRYKLFGFKFAPFVFGNGSLLTHENGDPGSSGLYGGIGGGVRTRNENFVFGTIELRVIYFPRYVEGNNSFQVTLSTNLIFRYNSNYVTEPDIVQSNTNSNNGIY